MAAVTRCFEDVVRLWLRGFVASWPLRTLRIAVGAVTGWASEQTQKGNGKGKGGKSLTSSS